MATFLNGDFSRAAPIVSSFYTIVDTQKHPSEEAIRFLISETTIQETFPKLLKELAKVGMIATAKRSKYESRLMPTLSSSSITAENGIVITISKMASTKPRKYLVYLPAILFAVTLTVVFLDGMIRANDVFAQAFIRDPLLIASVYTMSLMGILGVHEMGHMIANRWHGIKTSWPHFIPLYPGAFIPTLGAVIVSRANMTNRNVLFDVGISGPVAGLIVTIIVSVYGSYTSVLIPADQVEELLGDVQLLKLNTSILMSATNYLVGNEGANGDDVLIMSPVLFAAWVGFFVTFLNLMPAAQLDGGHIVRSTLGVRWHRILTYSSIGVLAGLGYVVMAILVLFIASRAPESTPLDDVSPLSKKRKMLFWVAMALAVLCVPIPQEPFRPLF
ncbi:site-2 protease family protein [Nitrososphaera sp.]|uniref:site-2 protease family protein n=1 Tax=Nitrososphaera sp. TaxID=1971748 RepID=UPI0017CB82E0|nr:site-2 protease family protein [Nitrososphaera sp.]NWG36362.1 site-2 protease family protein [Nitrososphaera sp.]